MNKETAAALVLARIPGAQIIRTSLHGYDANPIFQVEALHGDIVETFEIRIESDHPNDWTIQVESVDAYRLTEDEMDSGISLGSDDSMAHCY